MYLPASEKVLHTRLILSYIRSYQMVEVGAHIYTFQLCTSGKAALVQLHSSSHMSLQLYRYSTSGVNGNERGH